MGGVEIGLEVLLVVLLGATLFYAIRLHRSIGALRGNRESMDAAVAGFDSGTRQAETGLQRLREAARTVSTQLEELSALKDDLVFLAERGALVADRLDGMIRSARSLETGAAPAAAAGPVRSQAERDLMHALRDVR